MWKFLDDVCFFFFFLFVAETLSLIKAFSRMAFVQIDFGLTVSTAVGQLTTVSIRMRIVQHGRHGLK